MADEPGTSCDADEKASLREVGVREEMEEEKNTTQAQGKERCQGLKKCCAAFSRPFLAETYPLPPRSSCLRRFLDNFLCPPHSRMGAILFVIILTATGWATLVSLTGDSAMPGGNLFSLFILFIACWCGGYLAALVKMPPLLGMLIVGCLLGNVPHIDIGRDIHPDWSSGCRLIALTIILIRAGLGLDPKALIRLSFVVIRLAFLPCLTEAVVDGIAGHLILGLPWPWAFMLGFVIAAVSPAVVVPSLLNLSDRGYGIEKGIPTLVIAAASIDDVLAITGFGVMAGIAFSTGNLAWTLFKGPVEAIVGIIYGIVAGVIIWYIPQKKSKNLVFFRCVLLLLFSLMAIFGSKKLEWSGAGPLGALTLPFIAALKWRTEYPEGEKNPIEDIVGVLWMIFQPLLFGLIGAAVNVGTLDGGTVGLGIAVLCIGLVFRMVVSFLAVFGTNLTLREKLFIPFAWLPKATVQAAIGAVALGFALEKDDEDMKSMGRQILNLAVLSILMTAPFGSMLISITGPLFLHKDPVPGQKPLAKENDHDEDEEEDGEKKTLTTVA